MSRMSIYDADVYFEYKGAGIFFKKKDRIFGNENTFCTQDTVTNLLNVPNIHVVAEIENGEFITNKK